MKNILIYASLAVIAILMLAFQNFAMVKASEKAALRSNPGMSCPFDKAESTMHPLK